MARITDLPVATSGDLSDLVLHGVKDATYPNIAQNVKVPWSVIEAEVGGGGGGAGGSADEYQFADFGAVGDGVTSDRAAWNSAMAAISAAGGGMLKLDAKPYLLTGGSLTAIPENVHVLGAPAGTGEQYWITAPGRRGDYRELPYALYVDADTLATRSLCSIQGVAIIKAGIPYPADAAAAITEKRTWTGTGLKIGAAVFNEGNDVTVADCFILGFGQAIYSDSNERLRIENVFGDCINGIWIDGSADTTAIRRCHFWPFFSAHRSALAQSYVVGGAADNGSGLVRITTSASHDVQTGHIIHVVNVGGVTGATGRFTATRISGTEIDLQGSTFGGTYTSGGTVYLSEAMIRDGIAYRFESVNGSATDWVQGVNLSCYGFQTGYQIGNLATDCRLTACDSDYNAAYQDQTVRNLRIIGSATRFKAVGGMYSSAALPVYVETTGTDSHELTNINFGGHVSATHAIEVKDGAIAVVGGRLAPERVYLWDAADGISLIGCEAPFGGFAVEGESAAARRKCQQIGVRYGTARNFATIRAGTAALGSISDAGVTNDWLYVETTGAVSIGPFTAQATVPTLRLRARTGSASSGDVGYFDALMTNSSVAEVTAARRRIEVQDATASSEDATVVESARVAGTLTEHFRYGTGRIDVPVTLNLNGDVQFALPATLGALPNNRDMGFQWASNTTVTMRLRGDDGVTRDITLPGSGGGGGSGTVTSVDASGGTTGLSFSGGPVTSSGTLTLSGTLDLDNGGTGATTAAGARTNLGAAPLDNPTFTTAATVQGPINVEPSSGLARVSLRAAAGNARFISYTTGTSARWQVGAADNAESGSNAGSDFSISRFDDAGSLLGTPVSINRATGLVTLASGLTLSGGVLTGDGSGLTNLDAGDLASGTVPTARLGSGTADNTTYLRGDGTWATPAGSGSGSVTSVDVSGGTTGLTTSGGPITGSGTITLAGTLALANGGTGATDAAGARTALGLATVAATGSAADLTGNLAVARLNGGASASSATFWRGDGAWAATTAQSAFETRVVADNGGGNISIPTVAKWLVAQCWGGGGKGGGGGKPANTTTVATGGGGGGGGGYAWGVFDCDLLRTAYPSGIPFSVGAGGTSGGVGQTGASGAGTGGGAGGNTFLGATVAANSFLCAFGGGGGGAGAATAANSAGGGGGGGIAAGSGSTGGSGGGANGGTGAAGSNPVSPTGGSGGGGSGATPFTSTGGSGFFNGGGTGGGSGGNVTAANAAQSGGNGGSSNTLGGGAGGTAGGAGSAGNGSSASGIGAGTGGGGGASTITAGQTSGAGGAGGFPAGGGGGGAACGNSATAAGNGGNGGDGLIRLMWIG